jgi:endonuclease/exonuclease/phosphatase family protein
VAPCDGGEHAVHQPAGHDASLAAAAVDPRGTLEVGDGVETAQMESQQKAAQVRLPGIAARAGQDVHDHRLGDGDRAAGGNQFCEAEIDRASGGPVVFDPGRGVREDHAVVTRVRCVSGELVTIASLNTRGIPLTGSQLAERYAAIGAGFDAGDADVVCCQEVLTYWHLRRLVRRMRSFRQVSWRPGPFGPAGGLVTFSRRPVPGTAFRRFGRPPRAPGVPRTSRLQARLKGALVTRLARPELCVINTHPVANYDGDWSEANRFYPLHRAELAVLARVVSEAGPRAVVCGDFNVSRESTLFGEFMADTGLADAFGGACPATFRAEYLPAGATTHCIDFILTAGEVKAESAALVFAEKEPLGYVSDHIGLRARLSLTATAGRATPRPDA